VNPILYPRQVVLHEEATLIDEFWIGTPRLLRQPVGRMESESLQVKENVQKSRNPEAIAQWTARSDWILLGNMVGRVPRTQPVRPPMEVRLRSEVVHAVHSTRVTVAEIAHNPDAKA
jgi:hypothetical protein